MATDKNITMKQFNGTDYDTLYPKTIASQIPDVYSKSYIDSILKDNARIQTGSYVGTGTYGANNPCSLTFDFSPKLFMIKGVIGQYINAISDDAIVVAIWIYNTNGLWSVGGYASGATVSCINNVLSYYNTTANGQANKKGETYNYVAIG